MNRSGMKLESNSFELLEAGTIQEALGLLQEHGGKAKVLAGGLDLLPRIRSGECRPEVLVSIQRLPNLNFVEYASETGVNIGALTTLRSLEKSSVVGRDYPALREAVGSIASVQVKNMSTAVGNICVATPGSDIMPVFYVLGAGLRIISAAGERWVPAEEFPKGVNRSVLEPGDLCTEVLLPAPTKGCGAAFQKLSRTAADCAKVNTAVFVRVARGTCEEVRIALGAVAPTTMRCPKAEQVLRGKRVGAELVQAVAEAAGEEASPITDVRSNAAYRRKMVVVLVRRALLAALERAAA